MMEWFSRFSETVAHAVGRPWMSAAALVLVVVWACSGPFFGFSDTWQLLINTPTTVITFLMVFVIQATQNRDTAAVHAKLDELIASSDARDELIGIDHKSEDEVRRMRGE